MNVAVQAGTRRFALVGTPNCGKTAMFNALTGSPAEGRQLCRRHRRAQRGGCAPRRRPQPSVCSICPAPIRCARAVPTRKSPATPCSAASPARSPPDVAALRRRRHQSAPGAAAGARTQGRRPAAAAGAQHDRHRRRQRGLDIDLERLSRRTRRADRRHVAHCAAAASTRCAPPSTHWPPTTPTPTDELAGEPDQRRAARRPARGRPHHQGPRPHAAANARHADRAARCGAAASGRRPGHPAGPAVLDVPGGVHLGAAADGPDHRPASMARRGWSHDACPTACCRASCRTASSPASAA